MGPDGMSSDEDPDFDGSDSDGGSDDDNSSPSPRKGKVPKIIREPDWRAPPANEMLDYVDILSLSKAQDHRGRRPHPRVRELNNPYISTRPVATIPKTLPSNFYRATMLTNRLKASASLDVVSIIGAFAACVRKYLI